MPCYHPRVMVADGLTSSGKTKYKFVPGAIGMHHTNEYLDSLPADWKDKVITVPCKKCIGCRLEYSRRWADRMMLELDHSKVGIFVTLTYNDEHLTYGDEVYIPDVLTGEALPRRFPTTVKRDIQLFHKRLREHFYPRKIRYYTVAEYGPERARPHYHSIYFGLSLSDFPDIVLDHYNRHNQPVYRSDKLASLWQNGYITLANVSWQSCAYVARYSLKKLGSEKGLAESRGVLPEWSLCSRRPGIGGYFFSDHPDFFENPNDRIFLHDEFGVKPVNSIRLPNYCFEKMSPDNSNSESDFGKELRALGIVNPELYREIKEQRKRSMNDQFFMEFLKQDKDELTYLEDKERLHENSVKALARNTVV